MSTVNYTDLEEFAQKRRKELKGKKLKRGELSDIVFTETLNRLSQKERLQMLYYCVVDDKFRDMCK